MVNIFPLGWIELSYLFSDREVFEMERFTVRVEISGKVSTFKFEEMRLAKVFAKRAITIKGNETCSIEIIDNKVNQTSYYHVQRNRDIIVSNLLGK